MGKFEKEANEAVNIIFTSLLYGIGRAIRSMFKAAFRMRRGQLIGFLLTLTGALLIYMEKTRYALLIKPLQMPSWVETISFCVLLLLPVWYLLVIGSIQELRQEKYRKEFEAVGFKTRNGTFPYLVKRLKDRNGLKKSKKYKEVYIFSSRIPMKEWLSAQDRIETALDRNIIRFSEGKNKKICHITTVPAGCKIPDMIEWNDTKLLKGSGALVLGETALETIELDLDRTPHILAAGETGSGKSVILRMILWQLILKGAKVFMLDFKGGVEFGKAYEKFGEVVTDRKRAIEVLQELCDENEQRLKLFRDLEVKNLPQYNKKTGKNLCRIGVICDEIAEMMDKTGANKEEKADIEKLQGQISSLARLSRATGINLILGMQRPDANVLTGQIKNNIPIRICGRFADRSASEIVLGNTDAIYLPDTKGRFLFRMGNITEQFQAYLFDDDSHMHGDVPEVGDMLIHSGEDQDELPAEVRQSAEVKQQQKLRDKKKQEERTLSQKTGAEEDNGIIEPKTRSEEIKAAKIAAQMEKRSQKLADTQEDFTFSWDCEGKEEDV